MNEYEFYLRFKLSSKESDPTLVMERLAAADCTDATVQFGIAGYARLEFIREAASAEDAIVSAIRDAKSALPDSVLVEAGPDFVGLTDVADLLGMTRQNMRHVFVSYCHSFPPPVYEGSATVWHLWPVLDFLRQFDRYKSSVRPQVLETALCTMQLNLVRQTCAFERKADREKLKSLATGLDCFE